MNIQDLPDTNLMKFVTTDVIEDFKRFKNRPEYFVGSKVNLDDKFLEAKYNDPDQMIYDFEKLMVGTAFIRTAESNLVPESCMEGVNKYLDWIRSTDFYISPASTRYHDAEPNGLLYHSLRTYNNMIELRKLSHFHQIPFHSIALVSLNHDLTKIGNYESYMRNVKNEQTGQWEQVPSYRWKGNPYPFGHGVTSMYLVSRFFTLTIEEMLAIRWHMGSYSVSERESGELFEAGENFPLVTMLQFADQLSTMKYN